MAPATTSDLLQQLRSFRETASVLYVGAHPDDENNRLMPYLARGRALRTGYLSLTRGDGGQNLIGSELGDQLGVIRTHELLAARRVDGGLQYFTRARDFGFSKDSADTLQRWDRNAVLADTVSVIRQFRPDVVISRFSPVPGGTHGHHTASAILALEAFQLAGDPKAFPEQLETLQPWQPKRVFWNSWTPPGSAAPASGDMVRLDAGGYDPLLGESFGEIGARGRSMHKSQGEGRTGTRGPGMENFTVLAGAPASQDLFDGIDTSWARIPGAASIASLADELIAKFDPLHPAKSVPAILVIRENLAALPRDPLVLVKQAELDRILQACLGLFVETAVADAQVTAGEELKLRHSVVLRSDQPVRWLGVRYPSLQREVMSAPVTLALNQPANRDIASVLPTDTPVSQPYWLREPGTEGMFTVADASLIGQPENPPAFPVEQVFEIAGQTLVISDEPVQVINDPVRGELRRRLDVIPPVSLSWSQPLELFNPGASKRVIVEVTAARAQAVGSVQLELPAGWRATPARQEFRLAAAGDRERFTFEITAPAQPNTGYVTAAATIGGKRYDHTRIEIRYDHIPAQLLQPPAQLKVVSLELATRGKTIGYLPGAGDLVGESLARMGYAVSAIGNGDLTPENLRRFDAIVVGVRAFNTRDDLNGRMPALFAYAEQGGTVVVQYNTAYGLRSDRLAPYPLELSRDRVTDMRAPVTLLAPEHPVLTTPNRISASDFEGWVQERARFVPRSWAAEFTPILAMNDPGEAPLNGTLLIARHGRGHFVHTSLSWFRELPAGVPGAYRLFANIVSLGR
jgi:LmbE family N-acetylglucosaminyl deacetylase